jgi:hypothetical protein
VIRRALAASAVVAGLAYLGAAVYLRVNERALVYKPGLAASTVYHNSTPAEVGLSYEAVRIDAGDGVSLAAWVVPADSAPATAPWVLVCHGQVGDIAGWDRPRFYRMLQTRGVNVLAFDWRGYGTSTGTPDEAGLYADARAAYDWLVTVRGIPAERVTIYGHSLGSGPAVQLATERAAGALVIEGAYTSLPDVAQARYPWAPVRLLATQRFPSRERLPRTGGVGRRLVIHSPEDAVIPFTHGETLFAVAPAPKAFLRVAGGHERAFVRDSLRYFEALVRTARGAMP